MANLKMSHDAQLASINRKLAGGDYLNVAKFVIPRSERSHIASADKFFGSDQFYAAMPPEWSYEKMKDVDLWNTMYGQPGEKPDNPVTGIVPIHVWRRGPFLRLEGNGIINNIAPLITVQRFANKQLLGELGIETSPSSPSADESPETKKPLGDIHPPTIFKGDIVGAVLAESFSLVFDNLRFVAGVSVDLVTINKVGNVLYCQILITLTNGAVGGKKFDVYYLSTETIVISTRDNVYVISDVIPSDDPSPRGSVAAELTRWLDDFAILSE